MNHVALIIDDEVQIRRLLRLVLEGEHYKVHEAETGQQGLMEIATRKPDVVLLDLGLPDLEGLQVLKRLREWSEVPVIVLTVRDDVQEKVAALDAGADDYITKPFSTAELLARLRAAQRKTRPSEEVSVPADMPPHRTSNFVLPGEMFVHLLRTSVRGFSGVGGTPGRPPPEQMSIQTGRRPAASESRSWERSLPASGLTLSRPDSTMSRCSSSTSCR